MLREPSASDRHDVRDWQLVGFAFQNTPGREVASTGLSTQVEDVVSSASRLRLTFGLMPARDRIAARLRPISHRNRSTLHRPNRLAEIVPVHVEDIDVNFNIIALINGCV